MAIAAMAFAMLAIVWARVELYGIGDIEDALVGVSLPAVTTAAYDEQDEAVVRNRWIVGFSQ